MLSDIESLMCRIELKRIYADGNDLMTAEELANASILFMDHSHQTGDLRYLNTALKINDRLRNEGRCLDRFDSIIQGESDSLDSLRDRVMAKK